MTTKEIIERLENRQVGGIIDHEDKELFVAIIKALQDHETLKKDRLARSEYLKAWDKYLNP